MILIYENFRVKWLVLRFRGRGLVLGGRLGLLILLNFYNINYYLSIIFKFYIYKIHKNMSSSRRIILMQASVEYRATFSSLQIFCERLTDIDRNVS